MSPRTRPLLLLSCAAAFLVPAAGCGESDDEERLREAREQGEKEGRRDERLRKLEQELARERRRRDRGSDGQTPGPDPQPTPVPDSGRDCGGVTAVTSVTTCGFAQSTKRAYESSGGSSTIDPYSPTLGRNVRMNCTSGSPHVCRGGNNAVVRFP